MHNEELHNLYFSSDIIIVIMVMKPRMLRLVVNVPRMRNNINSYKGLLKTPENKRTLERARRRFRIILK
jgi:hypothetical protein